MNETERNSNTAIKGKTKKQNWYSENISQEHEFQKKSGEMAFGSDSFLKALVLYADKLFRGSFLQSIDKQEFAFSFTTSQLHQRKI